MKVFLKAAHRGSEDGGKDAHLRTQMVNVTVGAGSALGGQWSAFKRTRNTAFGKESQESAGSPAYTGPSPIKCT